MKSVFVICAVAALAIASAGWVGGVDDTSAVLEISNPTSYEMQLAGVNGRYSAAETKDSLNPRPGFGVMEKKRDGSGFKHDLPDPSKYEGMTVEERAAAMKEDFKTMLDEQVAAGAITQEQANSILEKFEFSPRNGYPGPLMDFGFSERSRDGIGFRFGPLDPSKYEGMTDEERAAAMKEDFKAMLDEQVAAGAISQEQADRMLECFHMIPAWPGNRPGFRGDYPGGFQQPFGGRANPDADPALAISSGRAVTV